MMRTWFSAERLPVQHVRHRRERIPVVRMHVRERPNDARPIQTRMDRRVLAHVNRIVVIHKIVSKRLTEHGKRDRNQGEADRDFQNNLAHNFVIVSRTSRANKLPVASLSE